MAKYEGYCFECGKVAGKTALKNHVLKEHISGDEECYLLRAESIYRGEPYWLLFTVPKTATLKAVDTFLRKIWCECCGHMSCFESGRNEVPMSRKWSSFKVGHELGYTYDFGSETELVITVVAEFKRKKQKELVQLLARNIMQLEKCDECDGFATHVSHDWYEDCYTCAQCKALESEDYEYEWLKISNSPRSGVCAFEGGLEKWDIPNEMEIAKQLFAQKQRKEKDDETKAPENIINFAPKNHKSAIMHTGLEKFEEDNFDLEEAIRGMSREELVELNEVMMQNFGFPTLEQLKDAGELQNILEDVANMDPITQEEIDDMLIDEQYDEIVQFFAYLNHVVNLLDQMSPKEKKSYDFTNFYESYDLLGEAMEAIDDEDVFDFLDDEEFPTEDMMLTIDEIKSEGRLEEFLTQCEAFYIEKEEIKDLFEENEFDTLEYASKYCIYATEQLDQLTKKEKAGFDFANLYETRDFLIKFMTRVSNLIDGLGIERYTIPKEEKQSKKVANNVVNLFGETNMLTAIQKWDRIDNETQMRILKNVFCVKCGVTSMKENFEISQEPIGILLEGNCKTCDLPVARLIEEV